MNTLTGVILLDEGIKDKGACYHLVVTNRDGQVLAEKKIWGIGAYTLEADELIEAYSISSFRDRGSLLLFDVPA